MQLRNRLSRLNRLLSVGLLVVTVVAVGASRRRRALLLAHLVLRLAQVQRLRHRGRRPVRRMRRMLVGWLMVDIRRRRRGFGWCRGVVTGGRLRFAGAAAAAAIRRAMVAV